MQVSIITQNVDGLQQRVFENPPKDCDGPSKKSLTIPTTPQMPPRNSTAIARSHPQLIQAHGQKGLFKCLNSKGNCLYAYEQSWAGGRLKPPLTDLAQVPRCPGCGDMCPPQVLQFDEDYESHAFYQFDKASPIFSENTNSRTHPLTHS